VAVAVTVAVAVVVMTAAVASGVGSGACGGDGYDVVGGKAGGGSFGW
jgi:hypothetical protein